MDQDEYIICPWCEEEIDTEGFIGNDDSVPINNPELIRCPVCGEGIEVKISLNYSVNPIEKELFEEKELLYDLQNDCEEELEGYNNLEE